MNNKKTYYQKFDKDFYTSDGYNDYHARCVVESEKIIIPTIIKKINPQKHWKFLDVGCSLGGNIIALNQLEFNAIGTEISEYCLSNSEVKNKMIFGECFNLPFQNKSFEVVICMDIFIYLTEEEIIKSVQELTRVASKYIVFSTIDKYSKNADQEHNPDELRKDTVNFYSDKDYINLFESAATKLLEKNIFPPKWDFGAIFKIL